MPVGFTTHIKNKNGTVVKALPVHQVQPNICGNLKVVVALLLEMQLVYTKYCIIYVIVTAMHYIKKKGSHQNNLGPGQKNMAYEPFVDLAKICLPPLHMKLELRKNSVTAMNKEGEGSCYLRKRITRITDVKMKEGILVGP